MWTCNHLKQILLGNLKNTEWCFVHSTFLWWSIQNNVFWLNVDINVVNIALIDSVFSIHMWNHASNMQSKFSFLFTKWSNNFEVKFYSQSEATLLNTNPTCYSHAKEQRSGRWKPGFQYRQYSRWRLNASVFMVSYRFCERRLWTNVSRK